MSNPYSIRHYNADFPNNTKFENGELIVKEKILSEHEISIINNIAAGISTLLNRDWFFQDVALKAKKHWEGEVFHHRGNDYLYARRINPHVWVSFSEESYMVHYSKDDQIKLPWGELTKFTEYYL